ncbi:MAG: riboflavin synthase [Planctomycetes bacterium]|nr:riboflavin synthase [Planctomycetota bacterium]
MFTGLVEAMGVVEHVHPAPPGVRLAVRQDVVLRDAQVGDSIAINGCCLTVVSASEGLAEFEAGSETLSRTNLGSLAPGRQVNLERSLKVGDSLGGHFVTGHIDALGRLDRRTDEGGWATLWFRVPARLTRQMASKGSIAVDGVSLTLVAVEAERFSVALIPHTLEVTTLGGLKEGDAVNLETDLLAKYVEQQLRGNRS